MRSIRTDRKRQHFLEQLAATANVTKACAAACISRRAAYSWREDDPEFAAEWDEAIETAVDALEREAWRRAVEGYDGRPVMYKGKVVATVREYSDRLLELLLKAHRPDKYAERGKYEHAGTGGAPLEIVIRDLSRGDSE